jgi:hypothetical protein
MKAFDISLANSKSNNKLSAAGLQMTSMYRYRFERIRIMKLQYYMNCYKCRLNSILKGDCPCNMLISSLLNYFSLLRLTRHSVCWKSFFFNACSKHHAILSEESKQLSCVREVWQ